MRGGGGHGERGDGRTLVLNFRLEREGERGGLMKDGGSRDGERRRNAGEEDDKFWL